MLRQLCNAARHAAASSGQHAHALPAPSLASTSSTSCWLSECAASALRAPGSTRRSFAAAAERSGKGSNAASNKHMLEAAEARLQKLRKVAEQQNMAAQPPSTASRVMGVFKDASMLALAGVAGFSSYYSLAYRDTRELEKMVRETCAANSAVLQGSSSSSSSDKPGPPPTGGSTAASSSGSPVAEAKEEGPSAIELVQAQATSAWCFAMRKYLRARKAIEEQIELYTSPTYHKLLPDMAPELRGRVKTLVLDLDDLLVHKEWTRQAGWKIYKRPGVQDFLFEMGGYFEVVLFTDEPSSYAEPIINKLDPYRMVLYRLYKPETQYHEGKHVRDLSKLNRDLSQVLMISPKPEAWEFQPENTIKLKPWQPSPNSPPDTTLLDLIPMLQLIATKGVRDVRDVVRSYDGEEDVAKAFKARMSQVSAGQQQKPSKQKSLLHSLAAPR